MPSSEENISFKLYSVYDLISQVPTIAKEKASKLDGKRLIHSLKVGLALVLVSFLFVIDPLYYRFGRNAIWAVMTVVLIFEFYSGATLSKGLNRGIGTILGGAVGILAAYLADRVGSARGNDLVVGSCVFVLGTIATYTRLIPRIKRRYDYAVMIFILTFNMVLVSGVRADKVVELALDRLETIGIGFGISFFTSLLVFPLWAGDELHHSIASSFEKLGNCIEGCMEEYFTRTDEKKDQPTADVGSCRAVLQSKLNDETLAYFARWEPWHWKFGHWKFGLSYPWDKYLRTADALRELAATIITWKGCIQSPRQPPLPVRLSIQQPCEAVGSSLARTLKEFGESIMKMQTCSRKALIASQLQSIKLELNLVRTSVLQEAHDVEGLGMASFVFLLMEMVEKVETLAREVQELGEGARFRNDNVHDFDV